MDDKTREVGGGAESVAEDVCEVGSAADEDSIEGDVAAEVLDFDDPVAVGHSIDDDSVAGARLARIVEFAP